jgi:membrane protein DedA with SNARE-associated domain
VRTLFLNYLIAWKFSAYTGAFVLIMIEGDVIVFISAFLTEQKFFYLPYIVPLLIIGALIGDFLWYSLGKFISRYPEKLPARLIEKITKRFDDGIANRPDNLLMATKFIYGTNRITLIRSGMLNVPVKKFLLADAKAVIVWIFIVGGIAYGAAYWLPHLKEYFRYAEIGLALGILLFLVVERLITTIFEENLLGGNSKKQ